MGGMYDYYLVCSRWTRLRFVVHTRVVAGRVSAPLLTATGIAFPPVANWGLFLVWVSHESTKNNTNSFEISNEKCASIF